MSETLSAVDECLLIRARIRYLADEVERSIADKLYSLRARQGTTQAVDTLLESLKQKKKWRKRLFDLRTGLPTRPSFSELLEIFLHVARGLQLTRKDVLDALDDKIFDKLGELRNRASHNDVNAAEVGREDYEAYKGLLLSPEFDHLRISFREAVNNAESLTLGQMPLWNTDGDPLRDEADAVPNNLPRENDHDDTGIVGREEMFRKLRRFVDSPREYLLTIIANGGAGKTALVVDFLKRVARSAATAEKFDAILFVSLKTKQLTVDGVETLRTAAAFENLEAAVLQELGRVIPDDTRHRLADFAEMRVLLCLDNLESLLAESPDEFRAFWHETMPDTRNWKTIITSRIAIGMWDRPLEPLEDDSMAALARRLFRQHPRGAPDETLVQSAVEVAKGNPLALKYYIELLDRGYERSEAQGKTERDVVGFCFDHLSQRLSSTEKFILAALHELRAKPLTRDYLCGLLGISIESFREAFNGLRRAGLTTRVEDGASTVYQVQQNAQAYIRGNPLFDELRAEAQERDRRATARAHTASSLFSANAFDPEHVPTETIDTLKPELARVIDRINRKNGRALREESYEWFNAHRASYESSALFFYYFGRVCEEMERGSLSDATEHYRAGLDRSPQDPRLRLALGNALLKADKYAQARQLLEELWSAGYANPESSSRQYAGTLTKAYVRVLLYGAHFEALEQLTAQWSGTARAHPELGANLGIGRAAMYIRRSQLTTLSAGERLGHLCSARDMIYALLELEVEPDDLKGESNRFLRSLTSLLRDHPDLQPARQILREYEEATKAVIPIDPDTLRFLPRDRPGNEQVSAEVLERRGYRRADIRVIFPGFAFAEDVDGESHFVDRRMYSLRSSVGWDELRTGSELYVLSVDNASANKSARYRATSAYCVAQESAAEKRP